MDHEPLKQIAIVSSQPLRLEPSSGLEWHSYSSIAEALATSIPFFYILLAQDEALSVSSLSAIRHDARLALTPVFSKEQLVLGEWELVLDGMGLSLDEMRSKAQVIADKMALLPLIERHEAIEFRLLAYLYTRDEVVLYPRLMHQQPKLVDYPLARLLMGEKVSPFHLLLSLFRQGLLESVSLLHELQFCPFCDSGLVNFQKQCPDCESIDIDEEKFLHCFACGHTAPEASFLQKEGLVCEKCYARLRHYGIDYDRPLEDFVCHRCHHAFITPSVIACCLVCEKKCQTEALISRKIYSYRLSLKGIQYLKFVDNEFIHLIRDAFHYVDLGYFEFLLDWAINLKRRHEVLTFSVGLLRFKNYPDMVQKDGEIIARTIVDGVIELMRQQLRKTDVLARFDEESIVLLLPFFDPKHSTSLYQNLKRYLAAQASNCVWCSEILFEVISIDEVDVAAFDSKMLIGELIGRAEAKT